MDPSASRRAAGAVRLLVDAWCTARGGGPGAGFARRRAEAELGSLPAVPGTALRRAATLLAAAGGQEPDQAVVTTRALVRAAAVFERAGDHESAGRLFETAVELRPHAPDLRLHAGRAARRTGARDLALAHYRKALELDGEGRFGRLARIGEALCSAEGERCLSREIRGAIEVGDDEAAGVGLEARASLRAEAQRCREAIRDLCVCALRYPDRDDRARVAEGVAELLEREGDLEGAREALLLVREIGAPSRRAAAAAALHRLSRALGDRLGERRWARIAGDGAAPPAAAEPPPAEGRPVKGQGRRSGSAQRTALPVLRRWRDAVVGVGRG